MESIDDLLAKVRAEYQEKEQEPQPKKVPLFNTEEFKSAASNQPTYQPHPVSQNWVSPVEDSLLAQVKAEFAEQQRIEELKKEQQLQEEQLRKEQQQREEQLKTQQQAQRQREALTQEATAWLKNLNLRSEEGLWFEEFSYSYPSKLEAAIDYLQALRETHN